jgi:hypothetical protein
VTNAPQTSIARPTIASVFLQIEFQGTPLGSGTGFVVDHDGTECLITNFHVVSGRHPETHVSLDSTGAWPDSVRILHNGKPLGHWIPKLEPLYDAEGAPLWLEHPIHRSKVDVVALPLTELTDIQTYPYDPWLAPKAKIDMASALSIVGFPFGVAYGGAMAVWVRGFVASEIAIDFGDLPRFLIDSRTRSGQSGSPVINYDAMGSYTSASGGLVVGGGLIEDFVGVYSGRISEESDLGFVWKSAAIREVIEGGVRGTVAMP